MMGMKWGRYLFLFDFGGIKYQIMHNLFGWNILERTENEGRGSTKLAANARKQQGPSDKYDSETSKRDSNREIILIGQPGSLL
mmetsp:Transcript_5921/g.14838  ORF Transcript_5921/g.14838 Transcript_5921/m.14838 type:complete len:83 (-) Transcript_5921:432-680(-)